MVKDDIIKRIADENNFDILSSKIAVEATLKAIKDSLIEGEDIFLRGFGTFRFKQSAPRTVRNIKAGVQYKIAARKRLVFVPGKDLYKI